MKNIELIKGLTELTSQEKRNVIGGDRFTRWLGRAMGRLSASVANFSDSISGFGDFYFNSNAGSRR